MAVGLMGPPAQLLKRSAGLRGHPPHTSFPHAHPKRPPRTLLPRARQDGSFTMACDPHPLAAALNWRSAADRVPLGKPALELPDLPDREAQERGCLGASEAAKWRCPPPGLAGAALRELRCEEGLFIARLAARAAEQPA